MSFRYLLLLFFLWKWSIAPAQENYRVERFTTDNGLPSNGIKGLQWDETTGFLWIRQRQALPATMGRISSLSRRPIPPNSLLTGCCSFSRTRQEGSIPQMRQGISSL